MSYPYYAIIRGRKKGIVYSQEELDESIRGYPGASAKGFYNLKKASRWFISNVNKDQQSKRKFYAIKKGSVTGITENEKMAEIIKEKSKDWKGRLCESVEEALSYLGYEKGKKTYYVLIQGMYSGVYKEESDFNWAKKHNRNASHYMVFSTLKEARAYLRMYKPEADMKLKEVGGLKEKVKNVMDIYTDASMVNGMDKIGIGYVVQKEAIVIKECFKSYTCRREKMGIQQGEVLAIIKAIQAAEKMEAKRLRIHTDSIMAYDMIETYCFTKEKRWLHYSKIYEKLYEVLESSSMEIEVYKVKSHSGKLLNERADWLAKRALNIQGRFVKLFDMRYEKPSVCLGW